MDPAVRALRLRFEAALRERNGEELLSLLDDALLRQPDIIRHVPHEQYRLRALLLLPDGMAQALDYARERRETNPDDANIILSMGAIMAVMADRRRDVATASLVLLMRAEELMRLPNAAFTLDASDIIRLDLYCIMDHLFLDQVDEALERARSAFSRAETERISAAVEQGWLPQMRKLIAPYADRL